MVSIESQAEKIVDASNSLFSKVEKLTLAQQSKALHEIQAEISVLYSQYAVEGAISAAMARRLNLINQIKVIVDNAINTHIIPADAALMTTYKINAVRSYSANQAIIAAVSGIPINPQITNAALDEILAKPINGISLAERAILRQSDLAVRIRGTVTNGFVQGAVVKDVNAALKTVMEKDYVRYNNFSGDANHIVSQSAVAMGNRDAMEGGELRTTKTWVTAGDSEVRDAHALLDGQTVYGDEDFEIPSGEWKGYTADAPGNFGEPALDYNCRCWIVADVVKVEKSEE